MIGSILIADCDPKRIASIQKEASATPGALLIGFTAKEAQRLLMDSNRRISGIFINPEVECAGGQSIVRMAHQYHPSVPIFLIGEKSITYTREALNLLGVLDCVTFPLAFSELYSKILKNQDVKEFERHFKGSQAKDKTPFNNPGPEDEKYIPVSLETFLIGQARPFDISVRLGSGSYLVVIHAWEEIHPEQILRFLDQGLVWLYLAKADQQRLVKHCNALASAWVMHPYLPSAIESNPLISSEMVTGVRSKSPELL